MILDTTTLIELALFALAFCGYLVSRHIHSTKAKQKPVVCPLRMNCHAVVHSDYSRFMGVPLEIYGMIYYLLIAMSYLLIVFMPENLPLAFVGVIAICSLGAFIFSIYLVFIQLAVLRQGCFWCFVSAGLSSAIFTLTFLQYDLNVVIGWIINSF